MRVLGLDLGSRTLGIAVSDPTGLIASHYGVIRHNEEYDRLVGEVERLVSELKIDVVVLGFPKNMNNTIGPKGELSIEFQKKLEKLSKRKSDSFFESNPHSLLNSSNSVFIKGSISDSIRK